MRPDKSLIWLSKYLSLALTLPASVFAGFILAIFANRWVHLRFLPLLGILLGMTAGIIQVVREVTRESQREKGPK